MGLQLCFSEGGDSYDWNPIMQTILILSCLLAAASSLYLHHPLLLHPSSGYGLNQAHPGGGASYQHISRLTRERLKLRLTPLATMAFPWPTTPATPTGLESEVLDSPPLAMAAVVREAPSFPSLVREAPSLSMASLS